jgi:hypothetical protein
LRTVPSAQTTRAESRLSIVRPYLRRTQPSPPPSVSPATPVSETTPPGTTSPNGCVSRSTSRQSAPPCTRTTRACGSTSTPRILVRSITMPPSQLECPGHRVAAAADGHEEIVLAREPDRVDDVGRARAPDDEGRASAMHRVVDRVIGVTGILRRQQVPAERRAEPFERGVLDAGASALEGHK